MYSLLVASVSALYKAMYNMKKLMYQGNCAIHFRGEQLFPKIFAECELLKFTRFKGKRYLGSPTIATGF